MYLFWRGSGGAGEQGKARGAIDSETFAITDGPEAGLDSMLDMVLRCSTLAGSFLDYCSSKGVVRLGSMLA